MRHYEIVVMVRAGQHERGNAMIDRYQKMVTDSGGSVHRFEDWGSRLLAYPIDKQMRAQYFLLNIECGGGVLNDMREGFRFSDIIMRFLIVRRDGAVSGQSPIMREIIAAKAAQEEKEAAERRAAAEAAAAVAAAAPADEGETKAKAGEGKSADAPAAPAGEGETKAGEGKSADAPAAGKSEKNAAAAAEENHEEK